MSKSHPLVWAILAWRFAWMQLVTAFWSLVYNCYLRVHPGVYLAGWISVSGRMTWKVDPRARVEIGRGVRIHSGHLANGFGGHRRSIVWVLAGGHLELRDGAGFSSSTLVCTHKLVVGSRVKIGGACDIFDTDFHPLDLEDRMAHRSGGKAAPVVIEMGAFVGGRCIIAKGVTVGERAVVGAGSVVTKAIPAGEIWAGNPARLIGHVPATNPS
jgi:carbonic anhydrase/acetyltransferase-like protein (isoleucine patch superfamily)